MSSIFTKIVKGEIPSYKIAENEEFLAFLDIMPLVEGHTLVIPKREVDFIFDLEAEEHKRLWDYAREGTALLYSSNACNENVGD